MKTTVNNATLDVIKEHAYKPELKQAQIRQIILTEYPVRQVKSGGLFAEEEFGIESKPYESTRVAWVDVPLNANEEEIKKRIEDTFATTGKIRRTLSLKPIIDAGLAWALANGKRTMDQIREKQLVRNKNGEPVMYKHRVNGEIIESPQYKKLSYFAQGAADVDLRPASNLNEEVAGAEAFEAIVEEAAVTE